MADLKVKVGVDRSGFTTGLASMENSVKGFGTKVGGILAGAFAFDKIIQGFSNAIDKGDQLQDLANRFGVAASSLQEIGNAASTAGAGLEDVASAMNKLAKNAGAAIGGNTQMAEAFEKIGLSVEQLNGMSPQDLFFALSKAVASGALGMQDFTIAQELAGKGAGVLMETLRMGPEVIAANGQAMGLWTDETIARLSEASDAIKTFQNTMTIAFGGIAQIAVPLIKTFQDIVQLATMLGSAGVSALSGDFAGAAAIAKEATMIKSRRDAEEAKAARLKTGRVFDTEGSVGSASDKAFAESEKAAAKHELRLIDAQVKSKEQAEKMKADIEEKYRQRSLDREIEMEKKKNEQKIRLQDMLAREQGPQAEVALLESRAKDAAKAFAAMPSTDSATALAQARGELRDALIQTFKGSSMGDIIGYAESQAQQMLVDKGLAADLSGFAQPTEAPKPSDTNLSRDFFQSLKTSTEAQLKQDTIQPTQKAQPTDPSMPADFFDFLKTSTEAQLKQDTIQPTQKVQPIDPSMPADFFDSLKASTEAQLKQDGMQPNLPDLSQNMNQFRPLEKVPDIASELIVASKTLAQILEEIRKGDGSVFR
jgi:hypothetical protein